MIFVGLSFCPFKHQSMLEPPFCGITVTEVEERMGVSESLGGRFPRIHTLMHFLLFERYPQLLLATNYCEVDCSLDVSDVRVPAIGLDGTSGAAILTLQVRS